MPKLPPIKDKVLDDEETRIARVIAGRTESNDQSKFGGVVARWLREHPEQMALFIAWYEEQPAPVIRTR